ncbi:MAG: NADH-quinone oxidoreductase subunit C [Nitrososphaerales archaeon]
MSETPETEQKPPEREKRLTDGITAKLGKDALEADIKPKRIKVKVKPERITDAAEYIKNELGFDHVASVSGVDYPNDKELEIVYHIAAYEREDLRDLVVALVARIPREDPRIPTLTEIWPSSEYTERETYEMLGIIFEGHPRLERLILPEDWDDIPPLRKEFRNPGR